MPKPTKNYIFTGFAVLIFLLIILLAVFFFTQEPFRNDTQNYLSIKRDTWAKIQTAGKNSDQIKTALRDLDVKLGSIKCEKIDDTYRKECDTLKSKAGQAASLINSNSENSSELGSDLGMDIATILKN